MQKTARDMILSLALIVLAAGVVWLFIPHEDGEPPVKRVDYRVDLLTARRAASYPVAAPEGLPGEWKPTSVRFRGEDADAWHLGFHAPDGEYVAVEQSAGKREPFIEDATQGAEKTDATQRIGGETWTRYEGDHYDALVLEGTEGSTTVVTGTASFGQLATMAGALRTE
ncbi:DUF4245 domain-containing protein [Streptomyces capillispiralis]|uniref:Uncharacterized protein DUF4245 n=1 Tax=Streptomyces capillispiralis TaxID=68182 RepID=A0A561TED4_9ACTN|nr:DUF4245 domain-containing protein [Streptomyces capillispiralis]TWF85464.1 uncharacterized protein DUF4245 [Streptomyces capillispiralis]GHH90124.1 hypothetical protein GCM10017779_05810 [Streptomyces capillispiralis]